MKAGQYELIFKEGEKGQAVKLTKTREGFSLRGLTAEGQLMKCKLEGNRVSFRLRSKVFTGTLKPLP